MRAAKEAVTEAAVLSKLASAVALLAALPPPPVPPAAAAADAAANAAEEATKEFTAPPTTAITEEVAVASLPCTVVEVDVESVEEDTVVRAVAMEAAWVSSVEAADTVLEAAVRAAEDAVEEEEDPEPLPTPPPPVVPPLSVPEEERVVAVAVKEEMVMGTPTLYRPTPPAVVPNSPVTTVPEATPGPVTGDPTAMGVPPTLGDTEVTVIVVPLMVAV